MAAFSQLLDMNVEDAKAPPLKPAGTYNAVIQEYKVDSSRQKHTTFVRFTFNNVSPGPDITPDMLIDPNDQQPMDLSKWKPYTDFYMTEDAVYRLREMLTAVGVNFAGRSFKAVLPETKGLPVLLTVVQETITNQQSGETRIINKVSDVKGA